MSEGEILLAAFGAGGFVIGLTLFRDEDAIPAVLLALMCGCLMATMAVVILWALGGVMTVHFDDLSPGRCQCRYPLWKGRDRTGLVCGEPTKADSSYCAEHHAVVYEPATPRRVNKIEAIAGRIVAMRKIDCSIHPEFEEAK